MNKGKHPTSNNEPPPPQTVTFESGGDVSLISGSKVGVGISGQAVVEGHSVPFTDTSTSFVKYVD